MTNEDSESLFCDRDAFIRACGKRRYRTVNLAGFGKVRIQSLFASETPDTSSIVDWVMASAVDEDGDTIFGEMDREMLGKLDIAVARDLRSEILDHCSSVESDDLKKTSGPT